MCMVVLPLVSCVSGSAPWGDTDAADGCVARDTRYGHAAGWRCHVRTRLGRASGAGGGDAVLEHWAVSISNKRCQLCVSSIIIEYLWKYNLLSGAISAAYPLPWRVNRSRRTSTIVAGSDIKALQLKKKTCFRYCCFSARNSKLLSKFRINWTAS